MPDNDIATYDEMKQRKRPKMNDGKNHLISMITSDILNPQENELTRLHISSLIPYSKHPFKLYEGERLDDMVRSIKELGVLLPIIVRPIDEDSEQYEILSGHNRVNAARLIGLPEVPVIIKKGLSEDEAKLIVTETNLVQRSFADLLPSEKAIALQTHLEALKESNGGQGKRTDLLNEVEMLANPDKYKENSSSSHVGKRKFSIEITGDQYGLSKNTVARYVRIAQLSKPLQNRVDRGEISLIPAVSLSYLSPDEQTMLELTLAETSYKVDMKKAETLRSYSEKDKLTGDKITLILSGELNKSKKPKSPPPLKVSHKIYAKHFDEGIKQSEMEEIIDLALTEYFARQAEMEGKDVD